MLGGTADLRDWRHQDWLIVSTLYLFLLATSFLARKASLSECVARRAIISCSVPFTKSFRKIRLEIKWNTTFWVVPAENVRKQRNIWKGSPVFPDGIVQTEIFFNGFFDTSSGCLVPTRLSRWKCTRKGRREGDNVCTLPMVPYGASPVTRVSRSPLRCEKRSNWGGGWVSGLRGPFSVNGSDLYKW